MIEKFGIKQENDIGTFYNRIGLEPNHTKMFGVKDTDEIYRLTFDIHDDQSEPDWNAIEYWGWLDFSDMEYKVNYPPINEWACKLNLSVYKRLGG